jgi:hypothetical protein
MRFFVGFIWSCLEKELKARAESGRVKKARARPLTAKRPRPLTAKRPRKTKGQGFLLQTAWKLFSHPFQKEPQNHLGYVFLARLRI